MSDVARPHSGIRLIAAFEAAKGVLVLAAGFGLFALLRGNARHAAEQLLSHLHLNPANETPRVFLDAASSLDDDRLSMLAAGASAYATVRFSEAFGLWRDRAWAEWLGATSGGIYIPFELVTLVREPALLPLLFLVLNVGVVAILARRLWRRRRAAAARGLPG